MIDLIKLPPEDAERIAYTEGFTGVGDLFARVSDLEHTISLLIDAIEEGDPQKIATVAMQAQEVLE